MVQLSKALEMSAKSINASGFNFCLLLGCCTEVVSAHAIKFLTNNNGIATDGDGKGWSKKETKSEKKTAKWTMKMWKHMFNSSS